MKKREYFYFILIIFIFSILGIRLLFIQNNKDMYQDELLSKTEVYINGGSAPRGRILDTNGNVLVDNIGVNTIYYNKVKGISSTDEIAIAKELASILTTKKASITELKEYWLVQNNNGKDLITNEEYQLLEERKITSAEIADLKLERITDDMLEAYTELDYKAAFIYSLMNDGYVYNKKLILKDVSETEYAQVIEKNIPGITGELSWERIYLYGDTLKNIFGSVGPIPEEKKDEYLSSDYELTDTVGLSYLEQEYEEYLKGTKAKYLVNSDNTLTLVSEEK